VLFAMSIAIAQHCQYKVVFQLKDLPMQPLREPPSNHAILVGYHGGLGWGDQKGIKIADGNSFEFGTLVIKAIDIHGCLFIKLATDKLLMKM